MKKIVFINESLEGGGVETVLRNIIENFDKKEYEIKLVLLNDCEKKMLLKERVEIIILKNIELKIKNRYLNFLYNYYISYMCLFRNYFYLKKILKNSDILINMNIMNFKLNLLCSYLNIKKIGWLHCDITPYLKSIWYKINKKKWKYYNKILIVSKEGKKSFDINNKRLNSKVMHINNFLNKREISKKAEEKLEYNKKYIVSIGRLEDGKDFETLIKAYYKFISEENSKLNLVIVGDGNKKEELLKLIDKLNLNKRVELVGFQSNPYKWIKNSELLVLSSEKEGLPVVLLEAMILGVPIISTNCKSGPTEILENGKSGILIPVGDINEMKIALKKILENKELRELQLKNSKKTQKKYSEKVFFKNFKNIVKKV